ncbi:hypothetical protein ACWTU6_11560 [Mesorhizobium sp. BHbsci]
MRISNLETGKIVPNRSVAGRFEAFFRREYVQGAALHRPQPGMTRNATLLMSFTGPLSMIIDRQERKIMLDLCVRHRERHWKMPISHPRPSDLCLSGKLDDGQIIDDDRPTPFYYVRPQRRRTANPCVVLAAKQHEGRPTGRRGDRQGHLDVGPELALVALSG